MDESPQQVIADAERLDQDADEFYAALQDLLRAYQFRDREETFRCGISVTACYALEHIVAEGRVTVNELAAALHLDKSTASRVATALENDGYIGRSGHDTDKRALWLAATPEGDRLHDRIRRGLQRQQRPLIAEFDSDTRRKIAALLRRLSSVATTKLDVSDERSEPDAPPTRRRNT